ncbi:cytosine deaminase [Pusillimonas caeni]|uniref:cytosine deaminase n=1 Tax=Pusillimonas caeni TaxID=1348472 RepID=UPI000E59BF19|nr:cytosine deaminase [Pusillimonas caeni]TFL10099.1 cytosine deaminase [Pusillimonas caeni]
MREAAAYIDASYGSYVLANASVPGPLLAQQAVRGDAKAEMARVNLEVADGCIIGILPAGQSGEQARPSFDLKGAQVWPVFSDLHTHLDKTGTIPRIFPGGFTLVEAVMVTMRDKAHWTREELWARAEFALTCAWVHGSANMRTHVDILGPQAQASWPVMQDMREQWKGRVTLQTVAMAPIEFYLEPAARELIECVAADGGLLGAVTKVVSVQGEQAGARLNEALAALFGYAQEFGLDVDLHVDESGDPQACSLEQVARLTQEHDMGGRVVCGHCCSLSVQTEERQAQTLQLCKEAGLAIVSLPLLNTFLQDRNPECAPQWRGLPPLQRIADMGLPIALASDNCRDAFYPYGDYDLLEVLRETVRAGHLNRRAFEWLGSVTTTPAGLMGANIGRPLKAGQAADFVVFNARSLEELFARPQADRIVVRQGRRISQPLPAFSELDSLFDLGTS